MSSDFTKLNFSNLPAKNAGKISPDITNPVILEICTVVNVYSDYTTSGSITYPPGTIDVSGTPNKVYPFDLLITDFPLVYERVQVFKVSPNFYYRRIDDVKTSLSINSLLADIPSNPIVSHRLKLSEGDLLLQSRFGQSMRFSGYNNDKHTFSPTVIIRNGESDESRSKTGNIAVTEDINKDGSTIAITSGDYVSKFIPGSVNKTYSNGDFFIDPRKQNSIYAFEGYPSALDGNQVIITSDRLVFSSRVNEMIFWSKGQCGFITDSVFTVDSNLGINVKSHYGNIDIEAPEFDVNVNVGTGGKIYLGTGVGKTLSPVADGAELATVLGKFVDAIANIACAGILTPAGPTCGLSPDASNALNELRNGINAIASSTVYAAK